MTFSATKPIELFNALLYYARRLAEKLQPAAKLVELHGGHLVNMSLMEMIKASKSNTDLEECWFSPYTRW
nr:unnamed protein product [Digitaria exilis]